MKVLLLVMTLMVSLISSDPRLGCGWAWYSSPVSPNCRVNLSCSTSCQPDPSLSCTATMDEDCQEDQQEDCETVNMMKCEEEVICNEEPADCDEAGEVVEVGEECKEEVREECVPPIEEVCTSHQVMECQERDQEDCTKCEEVMEEVEVPCERDQEVCEEIIKPVCGTNKINCTEEEEAQGRLVYFC